MYEYRIRVIAKWKIYYISRVTHLKSTTTLRVLAGCESEARLRAQARALKIFPNAHSIEIGKCDQSRTPIEHIIGAW